MNEEEEKAMFWLKGLEDDKEHLVIEERQAITTMLHLIEKQQKEIEARLEEIDSLYKMMSAKDDKIEQMKEDYQILKDDIEGHRIAYVDTPEFEENYISKDKIKGKIRELEKITNAESIERVEEDINLLKELLGETND